MLLQRYFQKHHSNLIAHRKDYSLNTTSPGFFSSASWPFWCGTRTQAWHAYELSGSVPANSGRQRTESYIVCVIYTTKQYVYIYSMQHNHCPHNKLQVISKKRQWRRQNKTLTCPARQVMFWAKFNLTFV